MLDNSSLDFRTTFHLENDPKDASMSDYLMPLGWDSLLTTYGLSAANVKGIFAISSLMRGDFHNATAYAANDFSSPDIDGSTSPEISNVDGIALPLDVSEDVINDTYTLKYKSKLTISTTVGSQTSTYIDVVGYNYVNLLGAAPTGLKIQLNVSFDNHADMSYISNIKTVTYNSGTSTSRITFDAIAFGFEVSWGDATYLAPAIIFTKTNTVRFAYNSPNIEITHSSTCIYSQLTTKDETDYTKLFPYLTTQPTVTRAWVIQYPNNVKNDVTATTQEVIIGHGTSYNSGANIYTGYYTLGLTSTFSTTPYTYFTIQNSIVTSAEHKVECSLCLCKLKQCYDNLAAKYIAVIGNNPSEEERLRRIITQLDTYLWSYTLAQRCGADTGSICAKIKTLLMAENCNCDIDDDETDVREVLPSDYFTLITFNTGQITIGSSTDGFPSLPTQSAIHIFNTTGNGYTSGDIYQYNGTTWVLKGNWTGTTGTTGADGADGAAGQNGVAVLYNPLTAVNAAADTSDQTLNTYTLAANYLSNGDYLEVEGIFSVTAGMPLSQIGLKLGSQNLMSFDIKNVDNDRSIKLFAKVSRISAIYLKVDGYVEEMGTPPVKIKGYYSTPLAINLGIANAITTRCEKVNNGTLGDITSNLCITYFKKV